MGVFKLGGISISSVFSKPATKMYPVVVPEYYDRTAGHVEQTDMDNCIFCGMCERRCPTHAIKLDKAAGTWAIFPMNCITCGSCVRACPKNILEMQRTYTAPATSKEWTVVELSEEEKADREKKEAEKKAARAKKAAEAAAKKAAAEAEKASE